MAGNDTAKALVTGGMVPPRELFPEGVLPTEQLSAAGRPRRELRADLRRIPNGRNALTVAGLWIQVFGIAFVAYTLAHPLAYVVAFLLMSRVITLCAIVMHEAAHGLLFSNRRVNDFVGRWLVAYPALIPFAAYRRGHMAHHRDAFGPDEPDLLLYANYPISRASFFRKLLRDALFVSGLKISLALLLSLTRKKARPITLRMLFTQAVMWGLLALATAWWVYPVLWLLPWLTAWRVIARLRAVAEHAGLHRSDDPREATHHVRQGFVARHFFVPFNAGWHLAHHVDPGIPAASLPKLHAELEAAGWVHPDTTYPSYVALWRACVSHEADQPTIPARA